MTRKIFQDKYYYKWLVFANVAVGTFMSTLDGSIVNVALPTMAENFQVDLPILQWVVSAYLLTISSLLPTLGRLADMYGRSRVFSGGFLVFISGSLFCGLSSSIGFLVAARVVQAVGAAMMMANSMGIITATFPTRMRGRALGTMGTVVAAGSITGPSIGGILIANFGWQAIFFVNLPVGLLGFVVGLFVLPEDRDLHREEFDFLGALLFAGGMVSLLLGLSLTRFYGWGSPMIIGLLVGSVLLLALFIRQEIFCPHPMIDLTMFRSKIFAFGNAAGLISFVIIFSVNILMPFYLQQILNLEPQQVGIMMTPFPLAMAFTAPISGWLSDRVGPMVLTPLGMVVASLNIFSMLFLTPQSSMGEVAVRLAVMGFSMSLFQSPNSSAILGSVARAKLGVAGGIVATMRNVGMVLGIALSVTVFTSRQAEVLAGGGSPVEAFMYGFKFALIVAACLCIVGAVLSLIRGKAASETANLQG